MIPQNKLARQGTYHSKVFAISFKFAITSESTITLEQNFKSSCKRNLLSDLPFEARSPDQPCGSYHWYNKLRYFYAFISTKAEYELTLS